MGNKEATGWRLVKIINVDHYQFSVERSTRPRAEAVPVFARDSLPVRTQIKSRWQHNLSITTTRCLLIQYIQWVLNFVCYKGARMGEEPVRIYSICRTCLVSCFPVWRCKFIATLNKRRSNLIDSQMSIVITVATSKRSFCISFMSIFMYKSLSIQ